MKMPLNEAIALRKDLIELQRKNIECIESCNNFLNRHISNLEILIAAGNGSPHFEDDKKIIGLKDSAAYNMYHELYRIWNLLCENDISPPDALTKFINDANFKALEKPKDWTKDEIFEGEVDIDFMVTALEKKQRRLIISESFEEPDWGDEPEAADTTVPDNPDPSDVSSTSGSFNDPDSDDESKDTLSPRPK